MPEGFASINDLKVVIDTNTEQVSAGLDQTRQIIAKFASDGTGNLGRLDGAMASLGTRVQGIRAAFGIWLPMLEVGLGMMQKFMTQAEGMAASMGLETEFAEFKKAVDALGVSVSVGLKHSFADTKDYLVSGGRAARDMDAEWLKTATAIRDARDELNLAGQEMATTEDAASDTAYAVKAFAESAALADQAVGQWLTTIKATTTETTAGTDALKHYAAEAAKISAKKMENPWGVKDPAGIIEGMVLNLKQLAAGMEIFVATTNKTDVALEGAIRSRYEEIQGWRDYATALAAGEVGVVSRWLFGSDPDEIRKKLASAALTLRELQEELASREKPTAGFDKVIQDIDKQIAGLEQKGRLFGLAAGEAAELLAREKALVDLGVEMDKLNKSEQERLTEKLGKVRELTDELKKLADTEAAYNKINALGDEADAIAFKISLIGQEAGAVARLTAEYKLKREAEGVDIDDEKMGKARAYIDLIEQNTRALEAGQAALGFDRAIDGIEGQARALREQAAGLDKSAGAAARYAAMSKLMYDEARSGAAMSDEQRAAAGAALAELEAASTAKDLASKERALARDLQSADKDVRDVERRAMALYMEAGAVAELGEQEKLIQMVKRHGLELDDARMERIRQLATAVGEATRATAAFQRQMDTIRSAGQATANAISSAFDQWMRGSEIRGREMVANLLREFAKLTLMQSVLNPAQNWMQQALGSILSPGGGSGGIGTWQTTTIPAMAQGGTLMPGVPTLVGERGPELILPRERASVIPNHAMGNYGAGGSVSISFAIDARGATIDAVAALQAKIAEMQRNLPRIIIETQAEARERGVA